MMIDFRDEDAAKEKLRDRVQVGADFLDKKFPDWHKAINLDIFDLTSGEHCICGQLFVEKVQELWDDESGYKNGYDYALENVFCNPFIYVFSLEIEPTNFDAWEYLSYEWIYHIEKKIAND